MLINVSVEEVFFSKEDMLEDLQEDSSKDTISQKKSFADCTSVLMFAIVYVYLVATIGLVAYGGNAVEAYGLLNRVGKDLIPVLDQALRQNITKVSGNKKISWLLMYRKMHLS